MEAITDALVLLTGVIVSSAIRRITRVGFPLPLIQIAVGALIGQVLGFRVSLDPDIFLLLFVAPLLFLDGWRISKEGLLRDKWTIGALALGLVLFTVTGVGFFIGWLIPAMPLPVAFALAAALSPTDAVAVSAIAHRSPLPKRLMHILEGEALLNDATGIVCLRFAIAAAVSGTFSLVAASGSFLWLATGGIAVGVAVTLIANAAKDWTARHFGEEPGTQILISLMIPLLSYILADRIGASGILAAVFAGIVMSYEERAGRALAATRIRRAAVWDAVQFAANGMIFVLLGQQMSGIVSSAERAVHQTGATHGLWLVFYIVAIGAALLATRLIWTWATLRITLFRAAYFDHRHAALDWRLVGLASLAGVRGAVTLAGIMTLPLTLGDVSAFPARELAILLAAGVIIMTLLVANAGIPILLRRGQGPAAGTVQKLLEDQARSSAAQAAMHALEHALTLPYPDDTESEIAITAGARLIDSYRQKIEFHDDPERNFELRSKITEIERRLRLLAIAAERDTLFQLSRSGKLTEELARALIREVDLRESQFNPF